MGICRFCGGPAERHLTLTDTNTGAKVQRSVCENCGPGQQLSEAMKQGRV